VQNREVLYPTKKNVKYPPSSQLDNIKIIFAATLQKPLVFIWIVNWYLLGLYRLVKSHISKITLFGPEISDINGFEEFL
jgi:hypothetical protein